MQIATLSVDERATPAPLLYPVKDAAAALGVSLSTVWRLIASEHLKTRKIHARTLVTAESLRRVAEQGTQ